jgi:ribosomal protein S18 acetylase RimI-like enzyme
MITIRKAVQNDETAIADFQLKMAWETEKLSLNPELVEKGVRAVFTNQCHGQYWVAEDNGKIVSSLLITYEWSDWRNTNIWWIQSVYVIPEYRRTGVFRSMYTIIRNEAEKQNIAGLRLYVELNNTRAQKTYEALGMNNCHYSLYEWLRE